MHFIRKEISLVNSFQQLNEQLDIRKVVSSCTTISKNDTVLCPFHNDTNPSMHINEDNNTLKCFSCGKFCDTINFYSKYNNLDMTSAAKELAETYGLQFSYKADPSLLKRKEEVDRALKHFSDNHKDYLLNRGIESSSFDAFKLGGVGNWIVQPIYDHNNKLVFLTNPVIQCYECLTIWFTTPQISISQVLSFP